jgi:hypothetical protein
MYDAETRLEVPTQKVVLRAAKRHGKNGEMVVVLLERLGRLTLKVGS